MEKNAVQVNTALEYVCWNSLDTEKNKFFLMTKQGQASEEILSTQRLVEAPP